jgi:hypothetical protein
VDPRLIPPLPAGSPWSAWARPDIHHCEANLAGWIAAPADTWSNLGYFAVGLWLLRSPKPAERTLGGIALAVGACSFAFHASYTYQGQFLDYAAMFLLTGWLLARGAARIWAAIVAASLALFLVFHALGLPVQTLMLAHVAGLLIRGGMKRDFSFGLAIGLFAIAYGCWHLDHADGFCRPDDHVFQWHAAWHLITAAAFLPLARLEWAPA